VRERALRELHTAGAPVTFETVARTAGISRSWLYTQPDIRTEIERLPCAIAIASLFLLPMSPRYGGKPRATLGWGAPAVVP
jgi:Family of unknown function (DUF6262)